MQFTCDTQQDKTSNQIKLLPSHISPNLIKSKSSVSFMSSNLRIAVIRHYLLYKFWWHSRQD